EDEKKLIQEFQLLTSKPVLYVCNVDEKSVINGNALTEKFKASVVNENAGILYICAAIESEIAQLESYEDRQMFLEEIGLKDSGVSKLISEAYRLLGLITYFTAGVQEVRAWTITEGTK